MFCTYHCQYKTIFVAKKQTSWEGPVTPWCKLEYKVLLDAWLLTLKVDCIINNTFNSIVLCIAILLMTIMCTTLLASWLYHKAFASLIDWINLCQVVCKYK